jgi:hypothetical protein
METHVGLVTQAVETLPLWIRYVDTVGPTAAAIAAVFVSALVYFRSRKDQIAIARDGDRTRRALVRPFLGFQIHVVPSTESELPGIAPADQRRWFDVRIVLENHGQGVAVIRAVRYFVGGGERRSEGQFGAPRLWDSVLNGFQLSPHPHRVILANHIAPPAALGSGRSIPLLTVTVRGDPKVAERLPELVEIKVDYDSVLDDEFGESSITGAYSRS